MGNLAYAMTQAPRTQPQGQGQAPVANPLINLMPLIFIFLIFYFLLIKPQKTKQQEHKKMIESLKKNDEVVTMGGLHATIINVKDKTLILRVDDNTRIEIDKEAVARLTKSHE